MKKTLLITGGSGFIGRNLIEALSQKYSIFAPTHTDLELTNGEKVMDYFSSHKIDVVIHCANKGGTKGGVSTPSIAEINLKTFVNLLHCKNMYQKMIYCGSGAEYDKRNDLHVVKEDTFGAHIPSDSYGFFKYVCSQLIEKEKNIVNLRLFGIYGKYEDYESRFISYSICRALLRKKITINRNVVFDYLYVPDFVKIVEYFINNKNEYPFYNVGRGVRMDLKTIAIVVRDIVGTSVPVSVTQEGLNKEYTCDISRLKKTMKKIAYTDFRESIQELVRYYQSILPELKKNNILNTE